METGPLAHRPPRQWRRVAIEVPATMTEAVADFLAGLSGSGAEISDVPLERDRAPRARVVAYLPKEAGPGEERLRDFLAGLARAFPGEGPVAVEAATIEEEDWGAAWKQHFHPFRACRRLVIRPSWEGYAPIGDEAVLEMDPGLAFGTGHHESTRLALELIEERFAHPPAPARVLDVGTGTGILGMACALWGAREVLGLDNDPDAVEAARGNVRRNGLQERMRVSGAELAATGGGYDLVVANISAEVLAKLAPLLLARLAPGGLLVLAGILAGGQEEGVRARCEGLGASLRQRRAAGEWAALALVLPGGGAAV